MLSCLKMTEAQANTTSGIREMAIYATIETRGGEKRQTDVKRIHEHGIIIGIEATERGEILIPWHRVWDVYSDDLRGLPD